LRIGEEISFRFPTGGIVGCGEDEVRRGKKGGESVHTSKIDALIFLARIRPEMGVTVASPRPFWTKICNLLNLTTESEWSEV
jgi:hypothetical protein